MVDMFNVEEMYILSQLKSEYRIWTIRDLRSAIEQLRDERDFCEACTHVIEKLENMTDEEYAALDFTVDEEDEYDDKE